MDPALRLASVVALVALPAACGAFLAFDDGIPYDGTSSLTVIDDGRVRQVLAWGSGGSGWRLECSGQQRPGVNATDDDLVLAGDGTLTVSEYEHGDEIVVLRIEHDGGGETRRLLRHGEERPFEPEGRTWLAAAVPRLIDTLGLGATTRVPRLLDEGGVDAVLADLLRRETDLARSEYYEAALASERLSSSDAARVLVQAGRQIDSDPHLADLLEDAVALRPGDAVVTDAVLTAAASIDSDPHLADLLETLVEAGGTSGPQLARLLDLAGASIASDPHLADVLDSVAAGDLGSVPPAALVAALSTLESDPHAADVLEHLVARPDLPAPALAALLADVGPFIASDPHLADVLESVPGPALSDDNVRRAFLVALETVGSDPHAADVLEAQIGRVGDPRALADLLRAAGAGILHDPFLVDVLERVPTAAVADDGVRAALRQAIAGLASRAHREEVLRRFPPGTLDG